MLRQPPSWPRRHASGRWPLHPNCRYFANVAIMPVAATIRCTLFFTQQLASRSDGGSAPSTLLAETGD
ncbi:hypothetical protein ACRALDRAFT_2022501 [Sodiomyces alcalophilus JCM 7366]|uniref:uncharacterized protein n=1 Tax=Sodiomyces alcalophilus JCM 7366 TaxID=591952 RepID=UPI0039B480FF